jgi:hypothetical protein
MSDYKDSDEGDESWRGDRHKPDDKNWESKNDEWEGGEADNSGPGELRPLGDIVAEAKEFLEFPFPSGIEDNPAPVPLDLYQLTSRKLESEIFPCPGGSSHIHRLITLSETFRVAAAGEVLPDTPSLDDALTQFQEKVSEVPPDTVEESHRESDGGYEYDPETDTFSRGFSVHQVFETAASLEEGSASSMMFFDLSTTPVEDIVENMSAQMEQLGLPPEEIEKFKEQMRESLNGMRDLMNRLKEDQDMLPDNDASPDDDDPEFPPPPSSDAPGGPTPNGPG